MNAFFSFIFYVFRIMHWKQQKIVLSINFGQKQHTIK